MRDLGTASLTWDDLNAIVQCRKHDTAISRALNPNTWMWQLPEMLMATLVDIGTLQLWLKTESAKKGLNRPKPIQRPGVEPERIGGTVMTISEIDERLGWGVRNGISVGK